MRWLTGLLKNKIILLVLVFGATFGLGALIGGQFNHKTSIEPTLSQGKTLNILFMGIDARDTKSNSRSDTMILASINTKTQKVALISIPRDTHIKDSFGHSAKINSVNYEKGPEAACEEVGDLLDTRVDYYVVTNFAGFGKIVDALGGVHINVEDDMLHKDPINPELAINLHKGYQYMDGKTSLAYVRYRGGPTADIGRTQRQQQFIKALAKEMSQTKTVLKLPKLLPEIRKYVHTNIPFKDMLYLASVAKDFEGSGSIAAQTLPGYPYTDPSTGASYWEVDKDTASTIIADLLKGKKFNMVSDPPDWIEKETTTKAVPQQEIIDEINKQEEETQTDQVDNTEPGTDVNNGDTTDPTDPGGEDGQTTDPGNTDGNTDGNTTNPTDPTDPTNPSDQEQLPPGDNPVQQPSNTVQ